MGLMACFIVSEVEYFCFIYLIDLTDLYSMEKCWERLEPPRAEKDIVGEWVGCIYAGQRADHLFVGKILRRFLSDDGAALNTHTVALEIDCLEEKLGTADCRFKEAGQKDIGVFPIHNVICGPVQADFISGKKWEVPQYQAIKKIFEKNKKLDRNKVHFSYIKKNLIEE